MFVFTSTNLPMNNMSFKFRKIAAFAALMISVAAGYAAPTQPATGSDCDFNAMLQPVPQTAKFSDPDFNIWCGSAVKGDDGKYHMFYSRWPRKLGHKAWVTHSEVAHAVADSPFGPWRHHDVALPARGAEYWDGSCTHNPTVLRIGSKYYLYYMGNFGDGVVRQPLNWTHRNHQRIGVAIADSPNGPWQRSDRPLLDVSGDKDAPDSLVVTNPSVCVRPDGGILMIYKAVGQKRALPFGGPVVHLVATSDHPAGPFKKRDGEVFGAKDVMFAAEDPFIWYGGDRYWAVVKDNDGNFTKKGYSLALWESADGFAWRLSKHPLVTTPEVVWADGGKQKLSALERPQVLFDNNRPIALFCAAADGAERDGSFNVQIPLNPAGKPKRENLPAGSMLPGGPDGWHLVWQDEFDDPNDKLDEKWISQNGPSGHILSSRWRENAVVDGGMLRLINRKEKKGGQDWTSGNIWTKQRFLYGYYECRYRYAAAAGTNNSFWIMTNEKPAPGRKSFEIDINEGHWPNKVNTNIHNHSDVSVVKGKRTHPSASKSFRFPDHDFAREFHTCGLEWTKDTLVFYLDGKELRREKNTICHWPAPVWLSLAIIKWAGPVTDAIDGTFMEVDYVRIYEKR